MIDKDVCFVTLCGHEFSARIADLFLEALADQFEEMYGAYDRYKVTSANTKNSLALFSNVMGKMSRTYNGVNDNNLRNLGLKEEEREDYFRRELRDVEIYSHCGRRFSFNQLPGQQAIAAFNQGMEKEDLVRFQELPGIDAIHHKIDRNKFIKEIVDNLIDQVIDVKIKKRVHGTDDTEYVTDDESEDEVENGSDHKSELLLSFQDITNLDGRRAKYYLESATWQFGLALANFYSDHVPELFGQDENESSDSENMDHDEIDNTNNCENSNHTENLNNQTGHRQKPILATAEDLEQKDDEDDGAELFLQFQDITNIVDSKRAKHYLDAANWDLEIAIANFYSDEQSDDDTDDYQDEDECNDDTSDSDTDDEVKHQYEITMKSLFTSDKESENADDEDDDMPLENQSSRSNQNNDKLKSPDTNSCAKSKNKWNSNFDINAKSVLRFFGGTFVIIAYLYYLPVL